jgi:cyclopropane fatty-acyl-phospholipid synthase-like methyltransferase
MFEAVGEKYWPTFFGKMKSGLKEGGTANTADYHYQRSGLQTYVRGRISSSAMSSPAACCQRRLC